MAWLDQRVQPMLGISFFLSPASIFSWDGLIYKLASAWVEKMASRSSRLTFPLWPLCSQYFQKKILESVLFDLTEFKCPCPDLITGYSGQAYTKHPLPTLPTGTESWERPFLKGEEQCYQKKECRTKQKKQKKRYLIQILKSRYLLFTCILFTALFIKLEIWTSPRLLNMGMIISYRIKYYTANTMM